MKATYELTYSAAATVTIKGTKGGDLTWSPARSPGPAAEIACGENPTDGSWVGFTGNPGLRLTQVPGATTTTVIVSFTAPSGGVGDATLSGTRK
jgi:hypothetical protein